METKICRICGKLGESNVHIFKTEGLKNKIETCLPIVVSPHSLLPDIICSECSENVENFYSFIKNCLQNIIVLEAQYNITESCLKTKRKHEKSSLADISRVKFEKSVQTEEGYSNISQDAFSANLSGLSKFQIAKIQSYSHDIGKEFELVTSGNIPLSLVDYGIDAESSSENEETPFGERMGKVVPVTSQNYGTEARFLESKVQKFSELWTDFSVNAFGNTYSSRSYGYLNKNYFDDSENCLINEIAQRRDLKRKSETILPNKTKIFKMGTTSNRRKSKQPKKVEFRAENVEEMTDCSSSNLTFSNLEQIYKQVEKSLKIPLTDSYRTSDYMVEDKLKAFQEEVEMGNCTPQICLLCDMPIPNSTSLAAHVYEIHGIDMAQVIASEPVMMDKRKKIPNLVKIADLKCKNESQDASRQSLSQTASEPPNLQATFVCPVCPAALTNRTDLFTHLKMKHTKQASLICGLCLQMATSYVNLSGHLDTCRRQHGILGKYVCKICCYGDDNSKNVENHVVVHDFVLLFCKKQAKMFDPCDYVDVNRNCESAPKTWACAECDHDVFATFKEFSAHRRSQHQIFHCDLCNKFYGRNSHLWKHVNRLHKGHPSITCQLCYKTSASKYHLAQHFNKIHSAKPYKQRQGDAGAENGRDGFMSQKFEPFDFQSVKQSFLRQELLEKERACPSDIDANSDFDADDFEGGEFNEQESRVPCPVVKGEGNATSPPKEIDSTSNLYTNIITNYTPPQNEGEFKCPKCFKGFHKKTLLKKHKKNCRPRLQKDLLTRCKTCSRIFKDRQSLTKHLINYHSEYACEICDQKVQSKCEIVSHIRFTHPNCHLFCSCGNILRSRADLSEHKKDHRNSFVCQFCADALPTKIKLKMHILSLHRKILSLSCGICLKLFETQHILRDHVRLVHKEHLTPLTSCTVCGKNYGSKWKTYDHLNKSHGRIFKPCKACLEVFDTDEQLQGHYDAVHLNLSHGPKPNVQNASSPSVSRPHVPAVKKDGYDSDFDQPNDDKNSTSEASNDAAESFGGDESGPKSDLPGVVDFAAHENKISLLEKRLLGKKCAEIDFGPQDRPSQKIASKLQNTTHVSPPKQQKAKHAVKIEKKSPKASDSPNYEDGDPNLSQNTSQNSSKRTVYVNSNDPSLCEICLKTWPAKKHLWQHYIRCHKAVAATVCGICLKTNKNYESLQSHLRENHPTLLHGQGFGSNFICRICGRYHNASSKLKLHMAIHEHFDWSILGSAIPAGLQKYALAKQADEGHRKPEINNGYADGHCEEDEHLKEPESTLYPGNVAESDDINYESLIEQVECSSESENESDVEECGDDKKVDNSENHDLNSSSEDESDESALSDENSLESQMLQNMLLEKQNLLINTKRKDRRDRRAEIEIKEEYLTSDSDESTNSNQSASDVEVDVKPDVKNECSLSDDEDSDVSSSSRVSEIEDLQREEEEASANKNIFMRKPEELDSAIRSITYEQIKFEDDTDGEFCDIQTQTLNETEIESAVGSIL